jgi:multidrug transporter EmrE-like cation transporter
MRLAAYTGIYVALSTSGLLVLRRSLPKISGGWNDVLANLARHPEVIAGGVLYALSFLTFVLALRQFDLTTVYPVFVGSGYVAVVLGSWLVLNEHISLSRGIGIAAIGLGLILVVR